MNRIANSTTGLEIIASGRNSVQKNTFLDNKVHAWFAQYPAFEVFTKLDALSHSNTYFAKNYRVFWKTSWRGNYWNESRTLPYPVFGRSGLLPTRQTPANRVEFDWNPANQPTVRV